MQSLHIAEKTHFSDHSKILLSWTGSSSVSRAPTSQGTQARQQIVADGPKGWCFVGSLTEDAKLKFAERVALDSRMKEAEAICCTSHFSQEDSEKALRLLWSGDPCEIWHFIPQLMGRGGSECECAPEEIFFTLLRCWQTAE